MGSGHSRCPEDDTRDVFERDGLPPRWGWWLMRKFADACRKLPLEKAPEPYVLFSLAMGHQVSQVITALAAMDVATRVKDAPKSAATLAREIGADEDSLYRVLRASVNCGVFTVEKQRGSEQEVLFKNNRLSALLRDDHENSLRHLILNNAQTAYTAWGELEWAVRTGGNPYERVNGQPVWEYFKANPDKEAIFTRAMVSVTSLGMAAVMEDYNWGSFARLVDIGGNSGDGLKKLLQRHPKLTGVCFDQDQVIAAVVKEQLKTQETGADSLLRRITFVGGSFFEPETLPEVRDGDLLFLRVILHDWSSPDCIRILRSLRQAVGGRRATLALVETVLKEPLFDSDMPALFLCDVHMLVEQGGRERTFPEYCDLLLSAGWMTPRLIETRGPMSVIEALPAPLSAPKGAETPTLGRASLDVLANTQ